MLPRCRSNEALGLNQGLPMFQELIDDYRRQAAQYIADAIELESGRWLHQDGDESVATAARKRGLAAMLFELADAYEEQDR
jgi:hypothetical protein